MFRKVRTLFLATVLMTAAVALGASPGSATQAPYNPDLEQACGLDFVLVLDRSGSIRQADAVDDVKGAANAFLTAMAGTGSMAAVVSFGETASIDVAAAPLTADSLDDFTGVVDDIVFPTSAATNWQDGLLKAKAAAEGMNKPLVILVTDGQPNRYYVDGDPRGPGHGLDNNALAAAVVVANEIKGSAQSPGSHIFALGVGSVNETGLKAVSGHDEWSGDNFLEADWSKTSFDQLDDELRKIAIALCGGTITVTKVLGDSNPAGWEFMANDQQDATGEDGTVRFEFDNLAPIPVTVTEVDRYGYALTDAACYVLGDEEVGEPAEGGVALMLGPEDAVTCIFQNEALEPGLSIVKTGPAMAHEGDGIEYEITVSNTGQLDLYDLVVEDEILGFSEEIDELLVDGSKTYNVPFTVPDGDDNIVNVASVCPAPEREQSAGPEIGCATDDHDLDVIHPAITIDKTADPLQISGSGEVTYTYEVKNTGDVALTGIKVTDDVLGEVGTIESLAAGESRTLTLKVAVDEASKTKNVGTASGRDPLGLEVSDTDDAEITVVAGATTTTTTAPTTTTTAPPTTTTTLPDQEPPTEVLGETEERPAVLPRTGAQLAALVLTGLGLLAGGVGFHIAGRRREDGEVS